MLNGLSRLLVVTGVLRLTEYAFVHLVNIKLLVGIYLCIVDDVFILFIFKSIYSQGRDSFSVNADALGALEHHNGLLTYLHFGAEKRQLHFADNVVHSGCHRLFICGDDSFALKTHSCKAAAYIVECSSNGISSLAAVIDPLHMLGNTRHSAYIRGLKAELYIKRHNYIDFLVLKGGISLFGKDGHSLCKAHIAKIYAVQSDIGIYVVNSRYIYDACCGRGKHKSHHNDGNDDQYFRLAGKLFVFGSFRRLGRFCSLGLLLLFRSLGLLGLFGLFRRLFRLFSLDLFLVFLVVKLHILSP